MILRWLQSLGPKPTLIYSNCEYLLNELFIPLDRSKQYAAQMVTKNLELQHPWSPVIHPES